MRDTEKYMSFQYEAIFKTQDFSRLPLGAPHYHYSYRTIDHQQVHHCQCLIIMCGESRGAMNKKELVPCSRRGLLAYVYNGVSLTASALVAGNGSYILRPCGHDLHGRTSPFVCPNLSQYWPVLKFTKFAFNSTDSIKSLRKTRDLTVL